nr:uncharacterized protein LOC129281659 [Lytechinus pictus]
MGSPLSPIVANLYMEEFESTAIRSSPLLPKIWLRYVDDTFVVWQHGRHSLEDFLVHLNSQHPRITFTMEKEKNNSILFLDVLVTREPNNHLSHQVYRKPTHTDRYLHFKSFHHPSILQSVPRTLVKRAHSISDDNHLQRELDHIKSTLVTINGYPPHKIKTRPTSSRPKEPTKATVVLPYLGPTSHKLQRKFRAAKIEVGHQSSNKLHAALYTHKDVKPSASRPGVYRIPCSCGKVYIGETGRNLTTRLKEYQNSYNKGEWEKSAIAKHANQLQHKILWEDAKLLTSIKHWHTRRV